MSATLPDLSPIFLRYETLAREADAAFQHIRAQFPQEVTCAKGCASCCHALFDLSLVEALYLNAKFSELFPSGMERFAITEKASETDRKLARVKRQIYRDSRDGKDSNAILHEVAAITERCPLLDDEDKCVLYEYRPITCRFYGVPTSIGGQGHTCGKTGFKAGGRYPTVFLDKMQERLAQLSAETATHLKSAYKELALMYVPVSTALITTYDAHYLGIGGIPKEK